MVGRRRSPHWAPDLVEALVLGDRTDEARRELASLEAEALRVGRTSSLASLLAVEAFWRPARPQRPPSEKRSPLASRRRGRSNGHGPSSSMRRSHGGRCRRGAAPVRFGARALRRAGGRALGRQNT